MGFYETVLPPVESFLVCISLRKGSMYISVICLIFSVLHIFFLFYLKKEFVITEDKNKGSIAIGVIMAISHVLFAIYNICLYKGASKEDCRRVQCWLFGATQNIIVIFLTELIASPFLLSKKKTEDDIPDNRMIHEDVLALWPYTILFNVCALIEFYFMIVVNSYYVLCKSGEAFRPKPCTDCNLHNPAF